MQRRSFLKIGICAIFSLFTGFKVHPALGVYCIEDSETHHYIATSESDALEQMMKEYGFDSFSEYKEDCYFESVERLDDDFVLEFMDLEENKEVSNTCREWSKLGRGCLCSTVW